MRDLHFSLDAALSLPLAQALALISWCIETNPYKKVIRHGEGYIRQEANRLLI
jgi:hypothetical protein